LFKNVQDSLSKIVLNQNFCQVLQESSSQQFPGIQKCIICVYISGTKSEQKRGNCLGTNLTQTLKISFFPESQKTKPVTNTIKTSKSESTNTIKTSKNQTSNKLKFKAEPNTTTKPDQTQQQSRTKHNNKAEPNIATNPNQTQQQNRSQTTDPSKTQKGRIFIS